MDRLLEYMRLFTPLMITIVGVVISLFFLNWLLLGRHPEFGNEKKLPRQLILMGFILFGVLSIAFTLPVTDTIRNQVVALIGILISGLIAFSSTTIVGNFMAGIMLRMNKPFNTGDFIRVGEHFGRVSERGLLDTEIQSDHRELISLPNKYLISNPIVVVSSTGAIISGTLSLGYDIHHSRIQGLLIIAARKTGLEDPFVQVIELGDDAITYRVSGLLIDIKSMLTTRSNLNRTILDTLHGDGIEIVSPGFINQRRIGDKARILARPTNGSSITRTSKPEDILFDKAEQAEQSEEARLNLETEIEELTTQSKSLEGDDKHRIETLISEKLDLLAELEKIDQKRKENPRQSVEQTTLADVVKFDKSIHKGNGENGT